MGSELKVNKTRVFGFTFLKNGVKLDYPFKESLWSLAPLCEKIYLAHGDSDDSTMNVLSELNQLSNRNNLHNKFKFFQTTWNPELRKGGLILSEQTNFILSRLRKEEKTSKQSANGQARVSNWGIYLQADEVLHEKDYEKIKQDIESAEQLGCDAIRFRYHHFWQSHHHVAINKKWYPQEIRAVRLESEVESWGDAQSFRKVKKIYESDAFIYHYGHVREEASYELKKKAFLSLYASAKDLATYTTKSEKKDANTEVLEFWGSHPECMKNRITQMGELFILPEKETVVIVGNKNDYSIGLLSRINAKNVIWFDRSSKVTSDYRDVPVIFTKEFFLARVKNQLLGKDIPQKMRSKLARPWSLDVILMFQLSAKMVGLK